MSLLQARADDLVPALTQVRGHWSPSLSPDGRELAFVSDADGTSRAFITPVGTWDPRPVGPPAEVVSSVAWSRGPGRWLVLDTHESAASPPGLLALSVDGTQLRPLTGPLGGAAFAGCWAPHGSAYAFSSVGPEGAEVVLLDADTGARRVLAEGGGLIVNDVSREGRAVLRRGPRGRRHLVVTTDDGGLVRVTPPGLPGGSADGRFAPDGRHLWLATDSDRDLAVLARVAIDDAGRPGPLEVMATHPGAELESWAMSEDGTRIILAWNLDGVSLLELLDPATGGRTPVRAVPWGVVSALAISADGRRLVVASTGPRRPPELLHVDLETLAVGTTSPPVLADDVAAELVQPRLVRFEAHDGLPLSGWLYRPEGATGPLPTVISLHGGPEAQERPVFSPLHQVLVGAGFAVLAPNVRGSSGSGRAFVELDGGLGRLDAIQDVLSCKRFLLEQGLAEAGHVGVHGVSYGGYLVLASIVESLDAFAAAACVCGIADFLTFFATTQPWIASSSTTKYGDPVVDAALLRRLSPLSRLHASRTPTLLVHGDEDTNVPFAEASQAHAALRAGGVTSELVVLPGEGHTALRPENRHMELTSILEWFRRFLP